MRLIWFVFIVSTPLYVWMGETVPGFSWLSFPNAGKIFSILSVFDLFYFFWALKKLYSPALEAIHNQPENLHAARHWMNSWICLCMHGEL